MLLMYAVYHHIIENILVKGLLLQRELYICEDLSTIGLQHCTYEIVIVFYLFGVFYHGGKLLASLVIFFLIEGSKK